MVSVAALVLGAGVLAACGNDKGSAELRAGDAGSLRSALSEVERRVQDQDCTGASQQATAFREQVDGLPERVDAGLRQALVSSADRLEALVADQCAAEPAAPTEKPTVGTTSEDPTQGNEDNQTGQGKKDKPPKEKKPKQDETPTQTQTQPDTGGAGEGVPGVGGQGDGTSPQE